MALRQALRTWRAWRAAARLQAKRHRNRLIKRRAVDLRKPRAKPPTSIGRRRSRARFVPKYQRFAGPKAFVMPEISIQGSLPDLGWQKPKLSQGRPRTTKEVHHYHHRSTAGGSSIPAAPSIEITFDDPEPEYQSVTEGAIW